MFYRTSLSEQIQDVFISSLLRTFFVQLVSCSTPVCREQSMVHKILQNRRATVYRHLSHIFYLIWEQQLNICRKLWFIEWQEINRETVCHIQFTILYSTVCSTILPQSEQQKDGFCPGIMDYYVRINNSREKQHPLFEWKVAGEWKHNYGTYGTFHMAKGKVIRQNCLSFRAKHLFHFLNAAMVFSTVPAISPFSFSLSCPLCLGITLRRRCSKK